MTRDVSENGALDTDEKRRLLVQYMIARIDYYGAYHHHKETTRWAALALFLTAGAGLIVTSLTQRLNPLWLLVAPSLALLASLLVWAYSSQQRRAKDDAGNQILAATSFLLKLLSNNKEVSDVDEDLRLDKKYQLPVFLLKEMQRLELPVEDPDVARKSDFLIELIVFGVPAALLAVVLLKLVFYLHISCVMHSFGPCGLP